LKSRSVAALNDDKSFALILVKGRDVANNEKKKLFIARLI